MEMVSDFILNTKRSIYETEYGMFTGIAASKLRNTKILSYTFDCPQQDKIGWYGGSVSLVGTEKIDIIIKNLLKPEV